MLYLDSVQVYPCICGEKKRKEKRSTRERAGEAMDFVFIPLSDTFTFEMDPIGRLRSAAPRVPPPNTGHASYKRRQERPNQNPNASRAWSRPFSSPRAPHLTGPTTQGPSTSQPLSFFPLNMNCKCKGY